MTKVVIDPLDMDSIQNAIDVTERCKKKLESSLPEFLQRMGQMGCTRASELFNGQGLAYAGYIGDTVVTVENRDKNTIAIVATGPMVLVLEFGSGVYFPDSHPEANTTGMYHGTYPGKGQGNRQTWFYYGEPGTTGWVSNKKSDGSLSGTHGNPANMSMWLTKQELQQEIQRIAKEVFEG